jgi:hypothetical protein
MSPGPKARATQAESSRFRGALPVRLHDSDDVASADLPAVEAPRRAPADVCDIKSKLSALEDGRRRLLFEEVNGTISVAFVD